MQKLLFIAAAVILLGAGCIPSHHTFNNAERWLPPGLDAKNTVLIIQRVDNKRQQRKIEEYMQAHYPYRYEFINPQDRRQYETAHPDKSVYRYEILNTDEGRTFTGTTNNGMPVNHYTVMYDFYFLDRTKSLTYPPTNRGSSWSSITFKAMMHTLLIKQPK